MWFIFGVLSPVLWGLIFFYQRLYSSWQGMPASVKGIRYGYDYTETKNSRMLRIGMKCLQDYNFTIRRETSFDRVFKFLGITKECQIGCKEFDQKIYISSNDTHLLAELQRNTVLQEALLRLLTRLPNAFLVPPVLRCKFGQLWLCWRVKRKFKQEYIFELAEAVVPILECLKNEIQKTPPTSLLKLRDPFVYKAAALQAISTSLAINGWLAILASSLGESFIIDDDAL